MNTKASYDDEGDNSLPHLPDMSVGSSVSSSLENEYNELLSTTMVVPFYEPEKITVKKVLQNSLGTFATHILPAAEDEQKKIADSKETECSHVNNTSSNEEQVSELNDHVENEIKPQESLIIVSKNEGKEEENNEKRNFDNETSFRLLAESTQLNKNNVELLPSIINPIKMEHDNIYQLIHSKDSISQSPQISDDSSSQTISSSSGSHLERLENEIIPNAQSLTTVSDEIYSIMQKQLEITQLDSNSFDANPRKDSPTPATPLTNIDLNINESISMEHTSNNLQSTDESKTKQQTTSVTDNTSKQLFKPRDGSNNRNGQITDHNKPGRIGNNLDKWLKELKAHVMSEFEKTKVQLMYEQQKKLYEEKERQTMEACKLKRELEITRERLKIAEINIIKKNEAIENVSKAFEKQREKTDLQRVMMEWKFKKVENEKEDFTMKIADKFYTHRLKIKSFLNWHCFMTKRHKAKLEKACKKKAEEVCYDLATKYETKIKKLEEEIHRSKGEIDCYKDEMAKSEDYMKKALMRGVCALNMEAMSIFHDNVSNKTQSQTSSLSSMDNLDLPNQFIQRQAHVEEKVAKNHVAYCSNNYQTSELPSNRSVASESSISKKEGKELAKKVKNYCEKSLSNKSLSAVAKAKMTLVNSGTPHNEQEISSQTPTINHTNYSIANQEMVKEQTIQYQPQNSCLMNQNQSKSNGNRLFTELTEHNLKPTMKGTPSSKHKIKSKINSFPSTPQNQKKEQFITSASPRISTKSNAINSITRGTSNLPPQAPAYRSVVIEKHTDHVDDSIKSNTSKVKYAPPGQPATVLNTVINSQKA